MGLQGSKLMLLPQAETGGTTANMVLGAADPDHPRLGARPKLRLVPDPAQWTCLGARRDARHYGCADIGDVVKDVWTSTRPACRRPRPRSLCS